MTTSIITMIPTDIDPTSWYYRCTYSPEAYGSPYYLGPPLVGMKKTNKKRNKKNKDAGWTEVSKKPVKPIGLTNSAPIRKSGSDSSDTLVLKGFPRCRVTNNDIANLMSAYGSLSNINILKDEAGLCRGTVFAKFSNRRDSEKAFRFGSFCHNGKEIKVEFAFSAKRFSSDVKY